MSLDNNITLASTVKDHLELEFKDACGRLAYELVHHDKSPLKSFVDTIGGKDSEAAKELLGYLQDNVNDQLIPDCI